MGAERRGLVGKALELREKMEYVHRPMRIKAEIEERLKRKAEKAAAQQGAGMGVASATSSSEASTGDSAQPTVSAA